MRAENLMAEFDLGGTYFDLAQFDFALLGFFLTFLRILKAASHKGAIPFQGIKDAEPRSQVMM